MPRLAPRRSCGRWGSQEQPYRFRVTPDMGMKREDADQLREVTVRSATGQPVPLGLLGHPSYVTTPAAIRTENGELVAFVYVDLNPGTDVSSYVGGAQRELDRALGAQEIRLEPGERIEWTGQYQLLAAAQQPLIKNSPGCDQTQRQWLPHW